MRSGGNGSGRAIPSPMEVARTAVRMGHDRGTDVEAYVEYGRTVTVKTFGREVESVTVAEPRGLGVRAVRDGRTGYAFTCDLSEDGIRHGVSAAIDNVSAADVDLFARLPSAEQYDYPRLPGLWRPARLFRP